MIEMSSLYYHRTLLPPTSVSHSCYGHFTSPTDRNLIIAKCTILQIFRLSEDFHFELLFEAPVNRQVSTLEIFRPHDESQDLLLIGCLKSGRRYSFSVLKWAADKIITRDVYHVLESGPKMCLVHPQNQMIALVAADTNKSFKFLPLDGTGRFGEPFLSRLNAKSEVKDVKFLHSCPVPTIVVLYQSSVGSYFVRTYLVPINEHSEEREFGKGPWLKDLKFAADELIPVPGPYGGVLAVGYEYMAYCSDSRCLSVESVIKKTLKRTALQNRAGLYNNTCGLSYKFVKDFMLLIGDPAGLLHLFVLAHDNDTVTGIDVIYLGETSIASTLSSLGGDFAFIGSLFGNSQAIKLNIEPNKFGSYVAGFELIENFESLGPILDFCIVDVEGQNQCEMVACSGTFKSGSIHVLRKSTYLNEVASLQQKLISGIWSLSPAATDQQFAKFVVVTVEEKTIVWGMAVNGLDLMKTQIDGFCSQMPTIFSHDAAHNQYVQITTNSVRLVCAISKKLLFEWPSPDFATIYVARANDSQVLVATDVDKLYYIRICEGSLKIERETSLGHILSIDFTPLGDRSYSDFAAVGLQSCMGVKILSLPQLECQASEDLEGPAYSVLFCALEGTCYLFCATRDGHVCHFSFDMITVGLKDKTILSTSMEQSLDLTRLIKFTFENKTHVFVGKNKPFIIYSLGKKLVSSYVNLKDVSHACALDVSTFPNSLAVFTEKMLKTVEIESIHKVHVHRTVALREPAHRICHQKQSGTFGLCSVQSTGASELNFFHVLDGVTLQIIDTYSFKPSESGVTIVSCYLADDPQEYYCVGTDNVDGLTNDLGRILVFRVKDSNLELVSEVEMEEYSKLCYMSSYNGDLIVGGETFYLFKWKSGQLIQERRYPVQTFDGTHGNRVLQINKVGPKQVIRNNVAIGHHDEMLSALESLRGNLFLGGLINNGIVAIMLMKRAAGSNDVYLDIRDGLELTEHVTRFCQGSFATDLDGKIPSIIYAARSGCVGVIGLLPYEEYKDLVPIQKTMRDDISVDAGNWQLSFRGSSESFLDGDLLRRNDLEALM